MESYDETSLTISRTLPPDGFHNLDVDLVRRETFKVAFGDLIRDGARKFVKGTCCNVRACFGIKAEFLAKFIWSTSILRFDGLTSHPTLSKWVQSLKLHAVTRMFKELKH